MALVGLLVDATTTPVPHPLTHRVLSYKNLMPFQTPNSPRKANSVRTYSFLSEKSRSLRRAKLLELRNTAEIASSRAMNEVNNIAPNGQERST